MDHNIYFRWNNLTPSFRYLVYEVIDKKSYLTIG